MDENSEIRIDVSTDQKKYTMQVECRLLNDGTSPIRVYLFNEAPSEEEQQESNSWHRMTRILSHEVMNTITPIVSLTDTLYEKSSDEEVREGLSIIRESSRGLLGFVNGYRALSKVPTPNIRPFKLKELTDGLVSHFSNEIERMKVTVTSSYEDPEMVLFADEQLTRQILINLFRNALNALSNRFCDVGKDIAASGPFISITVSTNLRDNTQIVISNNGTPIPIFHQDKIFEPFFTTKKEGTGIGLALSRQIMRAHNGTINLTASDERQTTFTITF